MEVNNVARPASSVEVPSTVEPFLKVIVPVAIAPVEEVTVAVNVTCWPTNEGLGDEVKVVVVEAMLTVCVKADDALPAKFALPPYTAEMLCVPAAKLAIAKVA